LTSHCYDLTRILCYFIDLVQLMNELESITSMAIGMNEWFAPQISEH
jgi:hypothetical protein